LKFPRPFSVNLRLFLVPIHLDQVLFYRVVVNGSGWAGFGSPQETAPLRKNRPAAMRKGWDTWFWMIAIFGARIGPFFAPASLAGAASCRKAACARLRVAGWSSVEALVLGLLVPPPKLQRRRRN